MSHSDQCIIGIDPGASGGIAWGMMRATQPQTHKMPETLQDLVEFLSDIGEAKCYLEKASAIPRRNRTTGEMIQKGSAGAFAYGQGYGQIEGVLAALKIPVEYITPRKWQQTLGCLTGGDKNVSKSKAQQLFPGVSKITHAIADAMLIWEYGRRNEAQRWRSESW